MAVTESIMPEAALGAAMTEPQAREIFRQGEEAVVFALLTQAKMLGESRSAANATPPPSTPSGMTPPYRKPAVKPKGGKRPGRPAGHPGTRRGKPERVDQTRTHRAKRCPCCGGSLRRCGQTRTRYTEGIPQEVQPVVTEHIIHRDWRPHCRKHVEPAVLDALPGATIGNRALVLSAWLHYGLGNTLAPIVAVFNHHLQFKLTPGGLIQMWHR